MKKLKRIAKFILIPIIAGIIGALLGNFKNFENSVIQPAFTPPPFIFPIAWTILYILMGLGSYFAFESGSEYKSKAILFYTIQLIINCSWNLFFFRLKMFMLSFYITLILIALVAIMTYYFFKCDKKAGLMQLPYLAWLIFASILTYNVYLLN